MEKIIEHGSWDFGVKAAELVRCSSRGLSGSDLGILVKRAGDEFANRIKNIKMAEGEIPVHLIAMGATEGYGPNRNGDGFKEAMLKACHKTFVKNARAYRHHKNKDKSKSYGVVKLSFYNEPMRRVELLLGLNGTKEAAEKNGGLLANEEMDTLESGKDLAVSMACHVPYDKCSSCGNEAKTRAEYCTEDNCVGPKGEKRGGCKHNLTKVAEDGHILHVDNPYGDFFDISKVIRPADRIAYGNEVDYMSKAASGEILGGAALAEALGITSPLHLRLQHIGDSRIADQVKLAYALAAAEDELELNHGEADADIARAFDPTLQGSMDISSMGKLGSTKCATGLAALSGQKIAMPLRDFLRLVLDGDSEKVASVAETVAGQLPGAFNRLIASSSLVEDLRSNPFTPSQALAPATQRKWAEKLAGDYSLATTDVSRRASLSAIRGITTPTMLQRSVEKSAAALGEANTLARRYVLYKLAFLGSQSEDLALTADMVVRQNYV